MKTFYLLFSCIAVFMTLVIFVLCRASKIWIPLCWQPTVHCAPWTLRSAMTARVLNVSGIYTKPSVFFDGPHTDRFVPVLHRSSNP